MPTFITRRCRRRAAQAELHEWLGEFWSHRLDRHRPLWEMTLLDGLEGGRWALATKTHHCLVDGVGSLDIGHTCCSTPPRTLRRCARSRAAPAVERTASTAAGRFWLSPGLRPARRAGRLGAAAHPRESFDRARAAVELSCATR